MRPCIFIVALLFLALGVAQGAPSGNAGETMHFAFVLLSEEEAPEPASIAHAFGEFAADGETIQPTTPAEESDPSSTEAMQFQLNPKGTAIIALVPAAVPNHEAEDAARFSVSSLGTGWRLPPHKAHLVVTLIEADPDSAVKSLSTFTSLLAAVAKASGAVAIYWGEAGATHDAEFFVSTARERDWTPKLMLWTGFSIAREDDGRLSILSLGMKQLDLPDLLVVAPEAKGNDALVTFFDLLAYVAGRDEPVPEGETVGRTPEERFSVSYVPSPVRASEVVWRVELE